MMREATLVTGLKMERVRIGADNEVRYRTMEMMPLFASDGAMLFPEKTINVVDGIVPVTRFCYGNGKPDLYVAYSHEVEEILGIPFQVILKEKEAALKERDRLRSMTAWQHIKKAYRLIVAKMQRAKDKA